MLCYVNIDFVLKKFFDARDSLKEQTISWTLSLFMIFPQSEVILMSLVYLSELIKIFVSLISSRISPDPSLHLCFHRHLMSENWKYDNFMLISSQSEQSSGFAKQEAFMWCLF